MAFFKREVVEVEAKKPTVRDLAPLHAAQIEALIKEYSDKAKNITSENEQNSKEALDSLERKKKSLQDILDSINGALKIDNESLTSSAIDLCHLFYRHNGHACAPCSLPAVPINSSKAIIEENVESTNGSSQEEYFINAADAEASGWRGIYVPIEEMNLREFYKAYNTFMGEGRPQVTQRVINDSSKSFTSRFFKGSSVRSSMEAVTTLIPTTRAQKLAEYRREHFSPEMERLYILYMEGITVGVSETVLEEMNEAWVEARKVYKVERETKAVKQQEAVDEQYRRSLAAIKEKDNPLVLPHHS